jgi:hypothetical protein
VKQLGTTVMPRWLTLLVYGEQISSVWRTAVHADGTASRGNQSDAGVIRDARSRTGAPRPRRESADIGYEMRNDARRTGTLRSLCWAARHQHRRTDAPGQHNAHYGHEEPPPQREDGLTSHQPILPPSESSSTAADGTLGVHTMLPHLVSQFAGKRGTGRPPRACLKEQELTNRRSMWSESGSDAPLRYGSSGSSRQSYSPSSNRWVMRSPPERFCSRTPVR